MFVLKTLMFCAAWMAVSCQDRYAPSTTPVPILKQINKQNDDGSYSFGYEAADGSFKIETKYANGDVAGKYGYVDEGGKLREISYGASSKSGFQPEGPGIMVPPPTLHDRPSNALSDGQEDDGQYREDPSIYEDPKYNGRTHSRPTQYFKQHSEPDQPTQINSRPALYTKATQSNYQSVQPAAKYQSLQPVQSQQTQYKTPLYTQESTLLNQAPQLFNQQEYRPQSQVYHQQPQFSYQGYTQQPNTYQNQQYQNQQYQDQQYQNPQYQNQQYQNPQYQNQQYQNQQYQDQQYQNQNYNPFMGHPAQSFDPVSGSYTINFTGR